MKKTCEYIATQKKNQKKKVIPNYPQNVAIDIGSNHVYNAPAIHKHLPPIEAPLKSLDTDTEKKKE